MSFVLFITFYIIDTNLILKKENSGKIKKIKANVINFDQSEDDIQTAEEVKSDNDVLLAVGDEAAAISITSYDTIVRFILLILNCVDAFYGLNFRLVILLESLKICHQLKKSWKIGNIVVRIINL